jgi:excisionase family DNA binding protein
MPVCFNTEEGRIMKKKPRNYELGQVISSASNIVPEEHVPSKIPEPCMTTRELAEYLNCSHNTIRALRLKGMPAMKIGRVYRFDLNLVKEWLQKLD